MGRAFAESWIGTKLIKPQNLTVSDHKKKKLILLQRKLKVKITTDNAAAIKNRLAYFPKNVVPVLRYYRRHNRLIRINGNQPAELVSREIDSALARRLKKQWPPLLKPRKK